MCAHSVFLVLGGFFFAFSIFEERGKTKQTKRIDSLVENDTIIRHEKERERERNESTSSKAKANKKKKVRKKEESTLLSLSLRASEKKITFVVEYNNKMYTQKLS